MHERNEESQHQNESRCIVLETFVCRFAYVDLLERVSWSRSKGFDFYPRRRSSSFDSLLHLVGVFFALAVVDETQSDRTLGKQLAVRLIAQDTKSKKKCVAGQRCDRRHGI